MDPRPLVFGVVAGAAVVAVLTRLGQKRAATDGGPVALSTRRARNAETARLATAIGANMAGTRARQLFASAERKAELDEQAAIRTAEQVVESLGAMKGAMMKIGQLASFLDDALPEPVREVLAQLQSDAPPMSGELAASVIEEELGALPSELFVEWDPTPIAAASIGQVHRAVWLDPADGQEKAVAVKVQYPGVDKAIMADLDNADLLGSVMGFAFKGLDAEPMVNEIRARIGEELDYEREAANQRFFAERFAGHPFLHVPGVVEGLVTKRVLVTELATGSRFDEVCTWPQEERDLAAESLFRFVFRSLYRFRAFNGDPHPGNYLFRKGGQVTFLDFGLVKHFEPSEIAFFESLIDAAAIHPDPRKMRLVAEEAGLLRAGAPISDDEVHRFFEHFYEAVREDRVTTYTPEYASETVRRVFDTSSPVTAHANVPPTFVIIQRINLGLIALLGRLGATGNFRKIAEELWPMVDGPPSTPLGQVEQAWLAAKESGI